MRLEFTPVALNDLKRLRHFIAVKDPQAAKRYSQTLRQSLQRLVDQPEMGRLLDEARHIRELIAGDYLARYRIIGDRSKSATAKKKPPELLTSITIPPVTRLAKTQEPQGEVPGSHHTSFQSKPFVLCLRHCVPPGSALHCIGNKAALSPVMALANNLPSL